MRVCGSDGATEQAKETESVSVCASANGPQPALLMAAVTSCAVLATAACADLAYRKIHFSSLVAVAFGFLGWYGWGWGLGVGRVQKTNLAQLDERAKVCSKRHIVYVCDKE